MLNTEKLARRAYDIRVRLRDTTFTNSHPLHAAELDLERKVIESDLRTQEGEPRQYVAFYY